MKKLRPLRQFFDADREQQPILSTLLRELEKETEGLLNEIVNGEES